MDAKTKEIVNDKIFDDVYNSKLTQQEQDFVLYYLDSYNIKQSFMKAYKTEKKYAKTKGYEVFHKPHIQSEIKRLKKLMQIGFDIDPTRYLEKLNNAANADIGEYIKFSEEEVQVYDSEGNPMYNKDTGEPVTKKVNKMHLANSDEIDTSVITKIKQGRDGISIELVDQLKAWKELRDFMGWQKDHEKEDEAGSNALLDVLKESAKGIWGDNPDKDLEDMHKAEKE